MSSRTTAFARIGIILLSGMCLMGQAWAQCGPDPTIIVPGGSKFGDILSGEQDVYYFDGNTNDTVTILMGEDSIANFAPNVQLFDPEGVLVASVYGNSSATIRSQLTLDGEYTILCRDYNGIYSGGYGVSLIKNPGSPTSIQDRDCGPISFGQTLHGTIVAGDLDACTFSGSTGQTISILMGEDSIANFAPQVELHRPDGTVFATASGNSSATISPATLDQTGLWYIICRDSNGIYSGGYGVSLDLL